MFIITVSDQRWRATYFRPTIETAAAKVGELKASGAVNIDVRDQSGSYLVASEWELGLALQPPATNPEIRPAAS